MKLKLFLTLIFIYPNIFSQIKIRGKIYGNKNVAKYVKVFNKTQNMVTFSDENGDFIIDAKKNDSILFSSSYYDNKKIIVNNSFLNEDYVFHLKESINELEEVIINSKFKKNDFEKNNIKFKNEIALDTKKNPHLYRSYSSNWNIDFVQMYRRLKGALYAKKNFKLEKENKYITYKNYESLFNNDKFFNSELLNEILNIVNHKKFLFFDFCEAKKIDFKYLNKENKFLLLNELLLMSKEFNIKND